VKKKSESRPIIREHPVTYDAYAAMPDDGQRYELDDGVLELLSAPTPKHQIVSSQMHFLLTSSCHSEYLVLASPVDLILSPTEVRQPDLVMIHRSKLDIITARAIEGIPDLVVEIVSPHSVKRDRQRKRKVYEAYRIPEYWIVDPANASLEQYLLAGEKYELANLYDREETVLSARLPCVEFTMGSILEAAQGVPG